MQPSSPSAFPFGFDATLFDPDDDAPSGARRSGHAGHIDASAVADIVDYDGPCDASGRLPPEFLAFRAGPDWPRARAQMQASIATLQAFARRHPVAPEPLGVFHQHLMDNDGAYYESYLPQLFGRGKRLLAACVEGLSNEDLPARERCGIFRRMVAGMGLCGMRIVDDFARARAALDLLRDGSLRRRTGAAIRGILEQEARWAEHRTPYRPGQQRTTSLEVHLVAAAIEELRLGGRAPRRDDVFTPHDGRVADLVEPLRERLATTLTPMRVARHLAEECVSRVSADLAGWLGDQPLDLRSGTRKEDDGDTSHCARLSMLVQGLEAAYGPLKMDAFVRTDSDGAMTLHRDATLVGAQIRRNLARQDLTLPMRERSLHEWPGTGGPRRLVLLDDDLAVVSAQTGDAPVDTLPEARHLRRVERPGLLGSPSTADPGGRLDAPARAALLEVVLRHAPVDEITRLPALWFARVEDALAMARRLGDDRFRCWCKLRWEDTLPVEAARMLIAVAESRGDVELIVSLLKNVGAQRSLQLWHNGAVLPHYLAQLARGQDPVAEAYLDSLATALPLLDAPTVAMLLLAVRAEGSVRPLLQAAGPTVLDRYLTLVEAAARENKARGPALAAALSSAPRDRPHWLRVLMTQGAQASRLATILGTLGRLHQRGHLDRALIGQLLIEPEAFRDDTGDGSLQATPARRAWPLCEGMAGDHDASVLAVLGCLLALCRPDAGDGVWLQRMLRASEGGAGTTALVQGLSHGATTALAFYLQAVTVALGRRLLSLPQAIDLLRIEPPPDGDGTGALALALRQGHLGTVELYWQRILEMQARGILPADQVRPLLRAESAGGVPALAEAFEHRIPGALDRYMALVQTAVVGSEPMSAQQLGWLDLRDAGGRLFWPPPGISPTDGWPMLKRYLRGLRALVEDRRLSPPQLRSLLATRSVDAPSLLGRLMSLEDRSMLTQCLDELMSWPRRSDRHVPALAAVLDIDELDDLATTAVRYPGLPDVLQALVSAVSQRWIDRATLRLRLEGRHGTRPPLALAFERNRPDVIEAVARATLRAGREARLSQPLVRRLLEAGSASDGAGAHVAFARGYDEALTVWLDSVLQARADKLLDDGDLRELLIAYGADERPGRDAASQGGHPRCLEVWREALRRGARRGWLSADDLAALDPAQTPPEA